MSGTYTPAEVAAHNKPSDLWIIVDGDVYDLTAFRDEHPVLQRVAGKDASKLFWKYHNEHILDKYKARLKLGSLDTKKAAELTGRLPAASSTAHADNKAPDRVMLGKSTGPPAPVPTEGDAMDQSGVGRDTTKRAERERQREPPPPLFGKVLGAVAPALTEGGGDADGGKGKRGAREGREPSPPPPPPPLFGKALSVAPVPTEEDGDAGRFARGKSEGSKGKGDEEGEAPPTLFGKALPVKAAKKSLETLKSKL